MLTLREATGTDVGAVVSLLLDEPPGTVRDAAALAPYRAAFAAIESEPNNMIVVGVMEARIVASYQLVLISGLQNQATRRAHIEAVRVAPDLRGQGLGTFLMHDAEVRARAAGCRLLQLTTHASGNRARDFYRCLGYAATHVGYKRALD